MGTLEMKLLGEQEWEGIEATLVIRGTTEEEVSQLHENFISAFIRGYGQGVAFSKQYSQESDTGKIDVATYHNTLGLMRGFRKGAEST